MPEVHFFPNTEQVLQLIDFGLEDYEETNDLSDWELVSSELIDVDFEKSSSSELFVFKHLPTGKFFGTYLVFIACEGYDTEQDLIWNEYEVATKEIYIIKDNEYGTETN